MVRVIVVTVLVPATSSVIVVVDTVVIDVKACLMIVAGLTPFLVLAFFLTNEDFLTVVVVVLQVNVGMAVGTTTVEVRTVAILKEQELSKPLSELRTMNARRKVQLVLDLYYSL